MSARDAMQRDVGLIWVDDSGRLLSVNTTLLALCGPRASLADLLPQLDPAAWRSWRDAGLGGGAGAGSRATAEIAGAFMSGVVMGAFGFRQ